MESILVVYTNSSGLKEFRRVPKSLPPTKYAQGIFCGPPDISTLNLSDEDAATLNNALVDAGYADFMSLNGQRAALLKLVQGVLGVSEAQARTIRNQLLHLYTRDYYPEKFEE